MEDKMVRIIARTALAVIFVLGIIALGEYGSWSRVLVLAKIVGCFLFMALIIVLLVLSNIGKNDNKDSDEL